MRINFSDEPFIAETNSIFLAGPTRRNSNYESSWRKEACDYLKSIGYDGLVYVPEFLHDDMPLDLTMQAQWERAGLYASSAIVFNFCRHLPDMPGFTTNIEFGMYLAKKPSSIILCCPDDAEKVDYVRWLFEIEKPYGRIYNSLEDALKVAVSKVKSSLRYG